MSGKRFLLDTNIVIGLFGRDEAIVDRIQEAKEVFIPSIVLGELLYGAEQSFRKAENVQKVELFMRACTSLSCDAGTAKHYAGIKSVLKNAGKPIPENDIWIAALSMQHKLRLVTRDAHFNHIAGLSIEKW